MRRAFLPRWSTTVLMVGLGHVAVLAWLGDRSGQEGHTPTSMPARPAAPSTVRLLQPQRPAQPVTAVAERHKTPISAPISAPNNAAAVPPPSHAAGPNPAAPESERPATYLPASALDRPALPRSAPDTHLLDDVPLSGLPLQLRLYIDRNGQVTEVQLLQAHPDDAAALAALQRMFSATAYIPGRLAGQDVASFVDIEIHISAGDGG
ncbi:MAG: hypothetical protein AB3X44_08230 [Leptothrix sp. (in: b-proteobacteria)]